MASQYNLSFFADAKHKKKVLQILWQKHRQSGSFEVEGMLPQKSLKLKGSEIQFMHNVKKKYNWVWCTFLLAMKGRIFLKSFVYNKEKRFQKILPFIANKNVHHTLTPCLGITS